MRALRHEKNQTRVFSSNRYSYQLGIIALNLDRLYAKGQSHVDYALYRGLLLFKITLLQALYNMSDYDVADGIK